MPSSPEEISFKSNGLTIAAKRWNAGAPYRAFAIHGWLDNCGSFDLIAPFLKDIDIIALDSAGHGKSDFRSSDSLYLIWSEVREIFEIADQLEWQTFNLIGHSRGANISGICAGTLTERIEKLVLIEGGVPLFSEAQDAPKDLAKHIQTDRNLTSTTKGNIYSSKEDALNARVNGFINVTEDSAKTLAIRSLIEDQSGFRWHYDARLKTPSSVRLTPDQVDAFLSMIVCPTLSIEGTTGILKKIPAIAEHLQNIDTLERVELEGGHHLHMEESSSHCVELIHNFIQSD